MKSNPAAPFQKRVKGSRSEWRTKRIWVGTSSRFVPFLQSWLAFGWQKAYCLCQSLTRHSLKVLTPKMERIRNFVGRILTLLELWRYVLTSVQSVYPFECIESPANVILSGNTPKSLPSKGHDRAARKVSFWIVYFLVKKIDLNVISVNYRALIEFAQRSIIASH